MKVYAVYEEAHGLIFLARTVNIAITKLVTEAWFNGLDEYYDEKAKAWFTLKEKYGENWAEAILQKYNNLDEDRARYEFNNEFMEGFLIDEKQVW